MMQDPLEVFNRVTTCPFCQTKFRDVVKLIPECGEFICGICYDHLKEGESKEYHCKACDQVHLLPENGLPDCKRFVDLLRHPVEKPLSEQAKKLKNLIGDVQEEIAKLEAFDPRDHIEQHCVQLELEVSQAAESAVKHIHEIEKDLLEQIRVYRQQCLDALPTRTLPEPFINLTNRSLRTLKRQAQYFSTKWNGYFKRLNVLASDNEIEAAIRQTNEFQTRIRTLEQETRNSALRESTMLFTSGTVFHSSRGHLGELVRISTQANSANEGKFLRSS